MKADFPYLKLPGARKGVLNSSSLWMGEDHCLLVRNTRFSEVYKRFYYKDIQAILIRQGPRFFVPPYWFIGVLISGIASIVFLAIGRREAMWFSLACLIGLVIWLSVESLFRSCTTHVKTAVSLEELTALSRTRYALRALDILRSKIEGVQGAMPVEDTLEIPAVPVFQAPSAPAQALPPSGMAMVWSLASFLFLFVDAGFTYFFGSGELSRSITVATSILILIETALLISAMVTLWGSSARGLRNLIIASLVFAGSTYYAASMGVQFSAAFAKTNLPKQSAFFQGYRGVVNWTDEVGNVILGFAGLVQWRRTQRR